MAYIVVDYVWQLKLFVTIFKELSRRHQDGYLSYILWNEILYIQRY